MVVGAYLKTHRPDQGGRVIVVSSEALEGGESGVVVPNDLQSIRGTLRVEMRSSPVTANLC